MPIDILTFGLPFFLSLSWINGGFSYNFFYKFFYLYIYTSLLLVYGEIRTSNYHLWIYCDYYFHHFFYSLLVSYYFCSHFLGLIIRFFILIFVLFSFWLLLLVVVHNLLHSCSKVFSFILQCVSFRFSPWRCDQS